MARPTRVLARFVMHCLDLRTEKFPDLEFFLPDFMIYGKPYDEEKLLHLMAVQSLGGRDKKYRAVDMMYRKALLRWYAEDNIAANILPYGRRVQRLFCGTLVPGRKYRINSLFISLSSEVFALSN